MWQKFISNLIRAFGGNDDEPSNKQILEKLEKIESELKTQGRISLYRYRVSIGISFIGFGLGASFAQPRPDWLVLILVFGGLGIIIWSGAEYIKDIHRKTAITGIITICIGIVVSAVQLYFKVAIPLEVLLTGFLIILIGFLISIVAAKPIKRI